jgi:hypothetical protein
VPFAYYKKLNARQKRIYDRSEAVPSLKLPAAIRLRPHVDAIAAALALEDRSKTEKAAGEFTENLLRMLRVSLVDVKVLAKRPSNRWGELHGLYEPSDGRSRPLLTVWMRTAMRKDVVAFKTFLRTLLHEIGHHLDYELLGLEDSYHTQGFYKRESSLYHQLVPDPQRYAQKPKTTATAKGKRGAAQVAGASTRSRKSTSTSRERPPEATTKTPGGTTARGKAAAPIKKEPVQGSLFD